ncbi:histidine kinase [beta proteobacterium AAP51]|nr:histidine kinase [beta proteobacterium AAP51]
MPVRSKLLALTLLPLLGVLPLLGAGLLWWTDTALDGLLRTKVRADLAVAHGYFERVLAEVGGSVAGVAESHSLARALQAGADLQPLLQRYERRERLDFLRVLPPDPALPDGTSVEVLAPAQQGLLGPALRERVAVPLLATRNAAPTERAVEDRAMVLLATRAVRDATGQLVGHVQGGVLLNRNLPFIDHINQIVYPEGSLPLAEWGSKGTATLFLDDVRISTNVRLFGGEAEERAIGTRVSQSVRNAVLGSGQTWLDRAFVVQDWYVSAYQPLADSQGRRVGMLYVGVLERPFVLLKWAALASIGVLFFGVMILAAVLSLRWARAIFHPLERMEATMQCVEGGDLAARVGEVASTDEIGRLAQHLDELLATIDSKTKQLTHWNAELDAKVAERTQELQDAQRQLVQAEKLATVGQLTASIAHEVNNPIAVIQGNLDLLRELLGPEGAARVAPELKLVDAQIERMRLIVTRLLQFARPAEFAGYVQPVDPQRMLEDCLVLAGHQITRAGVQVQRHFSATRQPALNPQELQQVLVNLLVNALHAMPGGGTLTLRTADVGEGEEAAVAITVQDSGPGLAPELLGQLFQPFVTRRKEGTGLGLWISRQIVERYGGALEAANAPPQDNGAPGGAVFTVRLRAEA